MLRKRTIQLLSFFIIILIILVGRLAQIQLIATENFTSRNINLLEESVNQRSQQVVIDDGRGTFLDENNEQLSSELSRVLVMFPFLNKMTWNVNEVANIVGLTERELLEAIENEKVPIVFKSNGKELILSKEEAEKINELEIPGVFAIERHRKDKQVPAEQLLGITGENEDLLKERYKVRPINRKTQLGITGLQASFDEFLISEGEKKLIYHVDAIGGPLFGVNVRLTDDDNPFFPVNIKTTLNLSLQKALESLVDEADVKKGGLILLDIKTNSILANVSRPNINKDKPFEDEGIENQMFKSQIAGSIFKIVVAAAALENNLIDEKTMFDCSKKINGDLDNKYNYGLLSFEDSFAKSCNYTFGQLAKELKRLDANIIERYANKLSLTEKVGWSGSIFTMSQFEQLHKEEVGRVFANDDDKFDDYIVALSAIGQHEVRLTPLAVANMMSTIAKGGKKEMVRAVSKINYKDNNEMASFKKKELSGETISPYTAMELQKLLRSVVTNEEGTGHHFNNLAYDLAGKSGTAQTGRFVGNEELYNKWFASFFPFNDPKYALVVVNLDVKSEEGSISDLFGKVVQTIYEHDEDK